MGHHIVLRIIGTDFSEEKEEGINVWYTTQYVPLILGGPATGNERYQLLEFDETFRKKLSLYEATKSYPKYLAMYEFESEKALNDYIRSPLLNEAQQYVPKSWRERGDFKNVWRVNYRRIAKRGDNDRSLAFQMVATNCPRGANEDEFNDWYTNDHIVFVLRSPEVIRAERYQRIGDDETYPKYLAIYRYKNERAIIERRDTWLGKIGLPDRRKRYPDDVWDCHWRVNYKLISKERKDLVV
jgi:hypothetical protein